MDTEDADKWIEKINAVIRVTFRINPEELSDIEWTQRFQEAMYVRRIELEGQKTMFKEVLFDALETAGFLKRG